VGRKEGRVAPKGEVITGGGVWLGRGYGVGVFVRLVRLFAT
jgi:hypothetical protein